MSNYQVEFSVSAAKTLRKMDPQDARRIQKWLQDRIQGQEDPRSQGKALMGQPYWRYRGVGDTYRVLVDDVINRGHGYRR